MRGTDRPPPGRRLERPVRQRNLGFSRQSGATPGRRKARFLAGACTLAVHVAVLALLFLPRASTPPSPVEPEADLIQVKVTDTPKPQPPGPPEVTMVQPETVAMPAIPHLAVRAPVPTVAAPPDNSDLLSASQLAGATSVGEGGGGGGTCDLARAVQQALRRDPQVHAAVEEANRSGKAIMLWNGDWVRSGGQDGKGLSAVREAVMWEVGFAPQACRNQPMHGLVLLSLADGGTGTRFAIGSGAWRWSDLLGVRGVLSDR